MERRRSPSHTVQLERAPELPLGARPVPVQRESVQGYRNGLSGNSPTGSKAAPDTAVAV